VRALATHIVKSKGDLERGINRLRAGIAEENIIEVTWCQRCNSAREFEGLGVRELESRSVIELGRLTLNRSYNRITIMTGIGCTTSRRFRRSRRGHRM